MSSVERSSAPTHPAASSQRNPASMWLSTLADACWTWVRAATSLFACGVTNEWSIGSDTVWLRSGFTRWLEPTNRHADLSNTNSVWPTDLRVGRDRQTKKVERAGSLR